MNLPCMLALVNQTFIMIMHHTRAQLTYVDWTRSGAGIMSSTNTLRNRFHEVIIRY